MEGLPEHFLIYQHNVQKFFQRHLDKYEGVIIPLSIAVSFEGGTYGFIRALCTKDNTKKYAIDPRSPLFQKTWNREHARTPHYKMADALGITALDDGSLPTLSVEELESSDIHRMTETAIKYQLQFNSTEETARKLDKYSKLLGVESLVPLSKPQFVIPPYFQMASETDRWCEVNLACIAESLRFAGDTEVRPVLHFGRWTDVNFTEPLKTIFDLGIRSVFLYPNDFHEHDAPESELRQYRDVVRSARDIGLQPYALFGGYFSALLHREGLLGFANGVGYGEWRDSGYHRGGMPGVRIYVPKLHRYLDPAGAQTLLDKNPRYFGSDSDLLGECALGIRELANVTNKEALDHFMECRRRELETVVESDSASLIDELRMTVRELAAIGPLERERFGDSLVRWHDALKWHANQDSTAPE